MVQSQAGLGLELPGQPGGIEERWIPTKLLLLPAYWKLVDATNAKVNSPPLVRPFYFCFFCPQLTDQN